MAESGIESRRRAAKSDGGAGYKARREEIVRVAAEVFQEKGYDVATLNDIAERLDTDRASLYYYVANKEELLQEIVRSVIHENVAAAERIAALKVPADEKLTVLIEEMITSFDRNYPHMYVYLEDLARISRQETEWARDVVESTKRFEVIVGRILQAGRSDGTFRDDVPKDIAGLALFGMVNWTHRWYRPGSKHSPATIAKAFTAIFLKGMSA